MTPPIPLIPTLAAAAPKAAVPAEPSALGDFVTGPLIFVALLGLIVCMLMCLYRLVKGPHLADRVLAGDTLAVVVAGFVAPLSMQQGHDLFFDVALIIALMGFASTVAFSQYIGARRKTVPDPAEHDPAGASSDPQPGAAA